MMMPNDAVIHLIDDDEHVRRAVAFLLGTAGLAVRVHESAERFLGELENLQPGCIVSDVRMPGLDGVGLLRQLGERGVDMPTIIMTGHADVALAVAAMKAGAVDFIEKPFDDEVLLAAVEGALSRYRQAGSASGDVAEIREKAGTLSSREREVLAGLLKGHPNKTIAYDLGLSARTVEVHRANLMAKMGAKSLSDLVRMAMTAKLSPENLP
jgi:two-component system, LuxR family, response regulator FixJ